MKVATWRAGRYCRHLDRQGGQGENSQDFFFKYSFPQVNSINKQFAFICDVITKIPNRELLYDLIPYLTNVRVILSACSRYLQWVGLRDCKKPLRCGPTLAGFCQKGRHKNQPINTSGLPGGVAGDLMRLYPVQNMEQFPLTGPPPSSSFTVLPFQYKSVLPISYPTC